MREDPLTAGCFILSWLMLTLGLTQLVTAMALRAAMGETQGSAKGVSTSLVGARLGPPYPLTTVGGLS